MLCLLQLALRPLPHCLFIVLHGLIKEMGSTILGYC
ncbi:hypothetical protein GLYMA_05G152851v4 [Glycine max]|nr:hypothetical protein GLYMA_05G152851v4 [Glycine max]KAH1134559.1 hypothetical protein GYH30_012752 [Glycine max]